jgi:hypothetical protein
MARSSRSRRSRSARSRGRSSKVTRWFGVNPWIVIGGAVALVLILLLVPMFPATKVVEVTDTKMVTVQTQVPETVTEDVPTKVYVGYMQEQGQNYGGYMPPIIIVAEEPGYGGSADTGMAGASSDTGGSAYYGPSYGPYGSSGRRYQVDASDEIVDFQQVNGPNNSLTITLTTANGKSTVYRYIDAYDLTKTGEVNIRTTFTRMKTVSSQEPKQITTVEAVPIRVNLIHLIMDATKSSTRTTVVQFLKQLNDAGNSLSDSFNSPALSAKMNSQDPNIVLSGFNDLRQQISLYESRVEELAPSSKVPELAEMKYCTLKTAFAFDSALDQVITGAQAGNVSQIEAAQAEISQIDSNPDALKYDQLQRRLQVKYNITNEEIDANPSADVTGGSTMNTSDPQLASSIAPSTAPSYSYDGTYTGVFNYRYRKSPSPSDVSPVWKMGTLGLTVSLKTRGIQDGKVTLDITRVVCDDPGFGALEGVVPLAGSNAVFPENPPIEGTIDCTMDINFPNGAILSIVTGKKTVNYINLYGKTLWGSSWGVQGVQSGPLSHLGDYQYEFNGWQLQKQTGPDIWGVTPINR